MKKLKWGQRADAEEGPCPGMALPLRKWLLADAEGTGKREKHSHSSGTETPVPPPAPGPFVQSQAGTSFPLPHHDN